MVCKVAASTLDCSGTTRFRLSSWTGRRCIHSPGSSQTASASARSPKSSAARPRASPSRRSRCCSPRSTLSSRGRSSSSCPRTPTRATPPRRRRGISAKSRSRSCRAAASVGARASTPPPHLVGERDRALDVLAAGGLVCASARRARRSGCRRRGRTAHAARPFGVGEEPGIDGLAEHLALAGYERVDRVEERGQFAVRGGLVDVFPSTGREPLRVELFGDEIEQIRAFSPFTQRALHRSRSGSGVPGRASVAATSRRADARPTRERLAPSRCPVDLVSPHRPLAGPRLVSRMTCATRGRRTTSRPSTSRAPPTSIRSPARSPTRSRHSAPRSPPAA